MPLLGLVDWATLRDMVAARVDRRCRTCGGSAYVPGTKRVCPCQGQWEARGPQTGQIELYELVPPPWR